MASIKPKTRGKCPHCLKTVEFAPAQATGDSTFTLSGEAETLRLSGAACPNCGRVTVTLETLGGNVRGKWLTDETFVVWPRQADRVLPPEIPTAIADEYRAAALIHGLDPAASAAVSRGCLRAVLRDAFGADHATLSEQIEAVRDLPAQIQQRLDAVPTTGRFDVHPEKDAAPEQIAEAHPGEAEWNLNVLDLLFDHLYVRPGRE